MSACPNKNCSMHKLTGKGNVRIKTKNRGIYYCNRCRSTWAFSKGSFFYNLKTPPKIILRSLMCLARGDGIREVARKERVTTDSLFFWMERSKKYKSEIEKLIRLELNGLNGGIRWFWDFIEKN